MLASRAHLLIITAGTMADPRSAAPRPARLRLTLVPLGGRFAPVMTLEPAWGAR